MIVGDVIALLALAGAGLLLGRAVGLAPIAAYLIVGVLVGPGGLGWVTHSAPIDQIAEIGVALLLFGVGIEFSLDRLRRRLGLIVVSGALQVSLTITAAAVIFRLLDTGWPQAAFLGFLAALSSTAIVFKLYADGGQIDAPQGQAAGGILLFQDLALVPMMLLVPVLATPGEQVVTEVGAALARGVLAVALVLFVARAALPRALDLVARARIPELFPVATGVVVFGTAFAATQLGLSLPIGTFLAGLAVSGSRYGHQMFAEVLPLRDVFVAVFFTSIGTLLDPRAAASEPALIVTMTGIVVVKAVVVGAVVTIVWRSLRLGVLAAFALAQIGEFSFVLSRAGLAAGLLPPSHEQAFLAAAILTMAATPLLVRVSERLAVARGGESEPGEGSLRDHVLIIGHGTTGQAISRVLRNTGISYCALDFAAHAVAAARREGLPVHFGDASRRAVLDQMGAARARAAVVTLGEPGATRRAVSLLRQMSPTMRILVRAQRIDDVAELESLGADEVVPSEFETSIELFVRLLVRLGVPRHVVRIEESLIRLDRYHALRGVGSSGEMLAEATRIIAAGILETAQVMEGSEAAGQTLAALDLGGRTGAMILSLVRQGTPLSGITGATRLEAGDQVVLYGPHEAIDKALRVLEPQRE